jgi:C-terminal regulatory domain of Threonine dehydratase
VLRNACYNIHARTGSFRALYKTVFPRNVTEFSYRYHDGERARILLSYQSLPGVSRAADAVAVQEALAAADYDVTDLSGNELAKVCVVALACRANCVHLEVYSNSSMQPYCDATACCCTPAHAV